MKRYVAAAIVASALVMIASIFLVRSWPLPDLGPRLQYSGKVTDGGCLLTLCVPETHDYYFMTDMTLQELQNYFTPARFNPESLEEGEDSRTETPYLLLGFKNGRQGFSLRYFHPDNAPHVAQVNGLRNPDGGALVMFYEHNYERARDVVSEK